MIKRMPLQVIALFMALGLFSLSQAQTAKPSKFMGQGLYEQTASNSCLYCHGLGGQNGKIAIAADLSKPKTWKIYKGIGGDAAFAKNKAEFLERFEQATVYLIKNGATIFNSGFKEPYYDKNAAGGAINSQMLGLGGSPSQAWLKKYKDRGVDKDIAARASYLYLKTIDSQGILQ